jgi:hypothetical protein
VAESDNTSDPFTPETEVVEWREDSPSNTDVIEVPSGRIDWEQVDNSETDTPSVETPKIEVIEVTETPAGQEISEQTEVPEQVNDEAPAPEDQESEVPSNEVDSGSEEQEEPEAQGGSQP